MEIGDSTSIAVSDRFFRQSMTALNDPIGNSGDSHLCGGQPQKE